MPYDPGRRDLPPTREPLGLATGRLSIPAQFASASYRGALLRAEKFSRDCTATVLIEGESGTGKTVLARRIHEMSPRHLAPFRSCVLSALDDTLASDELFGHVAGAFTGARGVRAGVFASATGGTVFLDEIGKASLQVQQKLIDAIESHVITPLGADRQCKVDVRIIAATNVPLHQLVEEERFLPDLHARLKSFRIALPPLRERAEDIPLLVQQCLLRHAEACGYASPPVLDNQLLAALTRAPWPNNLRELDGTVHRILLEGGGEMLLGLRHCVDDLSFLAESLNVKTRVDFDAVQRALAQTGKKKAPAAKLLGVSRSTVHRLLREAEQRKD